MDRGEIFKMGAESEVISLMITTPAILDYSSSLGALAPIRAGADKLNLLRPPSRFENPAFRR